MQPIPVSLYSVDVLTQYDRALTIATRLIPVAFVIGLAIGLGIGKYFLC